MSNEVPGPLKPLTGASGVLVFALLVVALVIGVSPNIDSQLVRLGESMWPGYAAEIRKDPNQPDCDLEAIDASIDRLAWIGRDSGVARIGAAMSYQQAGNTEAALRHAEARHLSRTRRGGNHRILNES